MPRVVTSLALGVGSCRRASRKTINQKKRPRGPRSAREAFLAKFPAWLVLSRRAAISYRWFVWSGRSRSVHISRYRWCLRSIWREPFFAHPSVVINEACGGVRFAPESRSSCLNEKWFVRRGSLDAFRTDAKKAFCSYFSFQIAAHLSSTRLFIKQNSRFFVVSE